MSLLAFPVIGAVSRHVISAGRGVLNPRPDAQEVDFDPTQREGATVSQPQVVNPNPPNPKTPRR